MSFKELNRVMSRNVSTLNFYFLSSLIVSFVLWVGIYFSGGNFFHQGFYVSTLLVGSYFLYTRGAGNIEAFSNSKVVPLLFIFQSVSLIGMSFFDKSLGGIYLALIPCCYGVYYFLDRRDIPKKTAIINSGLLFLILMTTYLFFYAWTDTNLVYKRDGLFFAVFALWGAGLVYLISGTMRKERQIRIYQWMHNSKNGGELYTDREHRDKMFFHDVVNQTHSLNLFLTNRVNKNLGVDNHESKMLLNEINLLQTLIRNHFGFKHKNIGETLDYVSFDFAKKSIKSLVDSYFIKEGINFKINYLGKITEGIVDRESCLIHYPTFHRILTNLIKNISESKTNEAVIDFLYDNDGLKIIAKNKILNLKEDEHLLSSTLQALILGKDNNHRNGIGLESIFYLSTRIGGKFKFYLKGDFWVNEVFLPNPAEIIKDKEDLKSAA